MKYEILDEKALINGLDNGPEELNIGFAFYPSGKPKKVTVTNSTLLRNNMEVKFMIHALNKAGVHYRRLGRWFNLSKDTAKAWADEANSWDERERSVLMAEIFTGKRQPDTDCLDLPCRKAEQTLDYKHYDYKEKPAFLRKLARC